MSMLFPPMTISAKPSPGKRVSHALQIDQTDAPILSLETIDAEPFTDEVTTPIAEADEEKVSTTTTTATASEMNTLFEMIGDLTERTKGLTAQMDILPTIQSEVRSLSAQISTFKEDITAQVADLTAQVLVNEEDIKILKQYYHKDHEYIVNHVKPMIKMIEKEDLLNIKKESRKIETNEQAILELRQAVAAEVDKTVTFSLSDEDMITIAKHVLTSDGVDSPITKLQQSVSKINEDINALMKAKEDTVTSLKTIKEHVDSTNRTKNNNNNNNSNSRSTNHNNRNAPAEHQTLKHDVIIIGDSNTKHIDMQMIGRATSRKRFTCYTIPQAKTFINTADIQQQPKKVVFHLGTNDVASNSDTSKLRAEFNGLIALARSKFPDARIYISSIFRRMDRSDELNEPIRITNNYLSDFCDKTALFTFIDNSNIHHRDMKDPKHVNPSGFHTFICNLRVAVFGEKCNPPRKRGERR